MFKGNRKRSVNNLCSFNMLLRQPPLAPSLLARLERYKHEKAGPSPEKTVVTQKYRHTQSLYVKSNKKHKPGEPSAEECVREGR